MAVIGYSPVLNSHPLMDDHLFFSWLDQTPWKQAIWHRVTGNWILDFAQMQMYRPFAGVFQVLMYQLWGPAPLPNHLLNLLLHCGTSLLAGLFAFQLNGKRQAGWLVGILMLLHPRATLGVSLIFNFYDPMVALLMLIAFVRLHSVRQSWGTRSVLPNLTVIWGCMALALGMKEVALPVVGAALLGDWLWKPSEAKARELISRHLVPVLLLLLYLIARTHFVGHPFQTHPPDSSFPLPAGSWRWTLLWDGLLVASCMAGVLAVENCQPLRQRLPKEFSWMMLWCGAMLLPAVHFCSQVTLKPWFFDERYWYVPLVPLTVLAGILLTQGNLVSATLGAGVLAVTLPGFLGIALAAMVFVASTQAIRGGFEGELRRTTALLFLVTLAALLWQRCSEIRLRADDAKNIHSQINKVVSENPSHAPVGILEFTEAAIEQRLPFNGDLQWLLGPPFFKENVGERLFFAYPTWDSPPTNRFRDRTTQQLLKRMDAGEPVKVYRWNGEIHALDPVGLDTMTGQAALPSDVVPIAMKRVWLSEQESLLDEREHSAWSSGQVSINPKIYRFVGLRLRVKQPENSQPVQIKLQWLSKRSKRWTEAKELWARCDDPLQLANKKPVEAEVWLFPGRRVDWLLGEGIVQMQVVAGRGVELTGLEVTPDLPDGIATRGRHFNHYANPRMKFQWISESWWTLEHGAVSGVPSPLTR